TTAKGPLGIGSPLLARLLAMPGISQSGAQASATATTTAAAGVTTAPPNVGTVGATTAPSATVNLFAVKAPPPPRRRPVRVHPTPPPPPPPPARFPSEELVRSMLTRPI